MTLQLITLTVGPWPMNAYLLIDETTNTSAIIDPGSEADLLVITSYSIHYTKLYEAARCSWARGI